MISTCRLGPDWLTGCAPDVVEEAVRALGPLEQQVMRDRLEHGLRFRAIAVKEGLRAEEVTGHHRAALKRLHEQLEGPTDWTPAPTEIPSTRMDLRYKEAKGRPGESLIAAQIESAERDLREPEALANDFVESVGIFSSYDDRDEPFYPTNQKRDHTISAAHLAGIRAPSGGVSPTRFWVDVSSTNHFASLMKDDRVVWPEPAVDAFVYVDREVVPARTTGGVKFTDGRRAHRAPRLDLLLADRADRTPVVAEVKVGGDQNPYYALIQLLMLGAQLATKPQLTRLHEWYPGQFAEDATCVDLVILLVEHRDWGAQRQRLYRLTAEIVTELMKSAALREHVRRIVAIELRPALVARRHFPVSFP